ncbi:MAG: tetratricopeptide repeat protein [Alphaproteobacteria bacterium]|nr:tetratricopeptide repeat protein [Alphaproteobacteria bacterium]
MREIRALRQVIVATLAMLLVVSGPAAAQQQRAASHEGFGRLVFDWDTPVTYTAKIDGPQLVITFSRAMTSDPNIMVGPLDHYLRGARLSGDHRTITYSLTGAYGLHSFTSGKAVVVDVMDHPGPPEPAKPAHPAPVLAPSPEAAPVLATHPSASGGALVPVRLGEHEKFDRLVFDWPREPRYTVDEQSGRAVITFFSPGYIDLAGLRRDLPPALAGIEAVSDGKSLVVTVPIPTGQHPHHFISEHKVVMDVPHGKPGEIPVPVPPPVAPVKPAAPTAPNPEPLVTAHPSETQAKTPLPSLPSGPAAPTTAPTPTPHTPEPHTPEPHPPAPPAPTPPAPTPPAPTPHPPAPPAAIGEGMTGEAGEDGEALSEPAGKPSRIVSLSFSWNQPAAAAVFRRAGFLWVVFDRAQKVDLPLLRRLGGEVVRSVEQFPLRGATVVRLLTQPGFNPSLRREGLLWIVDLMHQPLRPKVAIDVKVEPQSTVGPRIFLPVSDGGATLSVADPEIGDTMMVVPVVPLGNGVYPTHSYPDLNLLATAQGIVMLPRSDQVTIKSARAGVEILAPGGNLHLSRDAERFQAVAANLSQDTNPSQVFDILNWRHGEAGDYTKVRKELEKAVTELPEANQRNKPRLALARFEFASGRGAEAFAIESLMAQTDPSLLNAAPFRALRGATNFLMDRYDAAVEDLSHPSLAGNEEAAFWRAAAEASRGQPEAQAKTLRNGGSTLHDYPRPLKVRLALIGAESAIAAADDLTARNFLQAARSDDNIPSEKAAIGYETGRYDELTGNFDAAIGEWETVEKSKSRLYRAKASLAKIELLLRMKRITPTQAIESLEKLRFAWRGDNYEFNLVKRLGELYLQAGDYGNGLRTFKIITSSYRDNPETPKVAQTMQDTFEKLFLTGAADALPAVTAIALYDEFKELTPSGEKGDEMIRRLADRLVQVDLLDQAVPLLENQVNSRLKGLERAKVGARLALVALLNRQPQRALDGLSASDMPDLPPDLALQRRHLTARALADIGKASDAIALLKPDNSQDGRLLKAEIYRKNQDWPDAAAAFESLVAAPSPGEKVGDQQGQWILNWAIALTLAKDERGVAHLRHTYLDAVKGTPVYDALNLITSGADNGLLDYRQVDEKLKLAEGFQTFMKGYLDRVKKDRLSGIN